MTGEELVARDKRAKLSPEKRLLWSNDPASGVPYDVHREVRFALSSAFGFRLSEFLSDFDLRISGLSGVAKK